MLTNKFDKVINIIVEANEKQKNFHLEKMDEHKAKYEKFNNEAQDHYMMSKLNKNYDKNMADLHEKLGNKSKEMADLHKKLNYHHVNKYLQIDNAK